MPPPSLVCGLRRHPSSPCGHRCASSRCVTAPRALAHLCAYPALRTLRVGLSATCALPPAVSTPRALERVRIGWGWPK
eukprot:20515-Pleurochrysis_carterae.AAC.2